MRIPIIIWIVLLVVAGKVRSQCIINNTLVQDSVCSSEGLSFVPIIDWDTIVEAKWDLCTRDFEFVPSIEQIVSAEPNGFVFYHALEEDSGDYFLLTPGFTADVLTKISWQDSLTASPTVSSLGDFGLLESPTGIDLEKCSTGWKGLVCNNATELVSLDFLGGLGNVPVATSLGNFGVLTDPWSVHIETDKDSLYAFVVDQNSSTIQVIQFDSSLENGTVAYPIAVTGATQLRDIDIIKTCEGWFGVAVAFGNDKIYRLTFGSSLSNPPSVEELSVGFVPQDPSNVSFITENGEYFAIVKANKGQVYKVEFGDSVSTGHSVEDWGNLGVLGASTFSLSVIKSNGNWYGFSHNFASRNIYRIDFDDSCQLAEPIVAMSDLESGALSVGDFRLVGDLITSSGRKYHSIDTVVVKSATAAIPVFSYTSECLLDSVGLRASDSLGSTNYGTFWVVDGDSLSGSDTIKYGFSSAGVKAIELQLVTPEGCTSSLSDTIEIFGVPDVDFTFPSSGNCSFNQITFSNATLSGYGNRAQWDWSYSDGGSSSDFDGANTFQSANTYDVTLSLCGDSSTKQIVVADGPKIGFTGESICRGDSMLLVDTTSVPDLLSRVWRIGGDSVEVNDSLLYIGDSLNQVVVSLSLNTLAGCSSQKSDTFDVYDVPNAGLTMGGLCINELSSLVSLSSRGSNPIDIYSWSFTTMEDTIAVDSVIDFEVDLPGDLIVTLQVVDSVGCSDIETDTFEFFVCSIQGIDAPDTVCLLEEFNVSALESPILSYEWDFSGGDFDFTPAGDVAIQNDDMGGNFNLDIGHAPTGELLGVSFHRFGDELLLFNFENGVLGTPEMTNLGTHVAFVEPSDVKWITVGDRLEAIAVNLDGQSIYRVKFSEQYDSIIDVIDITAPTALDQVFSTQIVQAGNTNILFALSESPPAVFRMVLDDSLKTFVSVDTFHVSSSDRLRALDFMNIEGEWIGMLADFGSSSIYSLDFGSDIVSSIPELKQVRAGGDAMSQPSGISLVIEGGKRFAFIKSFGGSLYRSEVDYANLDTLIIENLGTAAVFGANDFPFDMVKQGSSWGGFTINNGTKRLSRVTFNNTSLIVPTNAESPLVEGLTAVSDGVSEIYLVVEDEDGNVKSHSTTVVVRPDVAPLVSFDYSGECLVDSLEFNLETSSFELIEVINWSFGDSSLAQGLNATHKYSLGGEYVVQVLGRDTIGCIIDIEDTINVFDSPTPNFALVQDTLCSNSQLEFVNLSAGNTGSKVQWDWRFGDGDSSSVEHPFHLYPVGENYTVSLTVCGEDTSKEVTVINGPSPGFIQDGLCAEQEVCLINTSADVVSNTISWLLDGSQISVDSIFCLGTLPAGDVSVELEVVNDSGCVNRIDTMFTIFPNPKADMDSSLLVCQNTSIDLIDRSSVELGVVSLWEWEVVQQAGDTLFSADKNPTFLIGENGVLKVGLKVESDAGCVDSLSVSLESIKPPVVNMSFSENCLGDPTIFTDHSSDSVFSISVWEWIIDGVPYAVQNPTHLFLSADTFDVSQKVIASSGCSSSLDSSVIMDALPQVDFLSTPPCLGLPTTFSDNTSLVNDSIISYNWNFFGTGITSQAESFAVVLDQIKTYVVQLEIVTRDGCSLDLSKAFDVNENPIAEFDLDQSFGGAPLSVQADNNSEGAVAYQWLSGDGDTSETTNPLIVYELNGSYELRLVAISEFGCVDTASRAIDVGDVFLDLSLSDFSIDTSGDFAELFVTVVNNGSVTIEQSSLLLNLGGQFEVVEILSQTLLPGSSVVSLELGTTIPKSQLETLSYVCIEGGAIDIDIGDSDVSNNSACVSLGEDHKVTSMPYPNPVDELLTFEIYASTNTIVSAKVFDGLGKTYIEHSKVVERGINQYSIDVSLLEPAVYFLVAEIGSEQFRWKIFVK